MIDNQNRDLHSRSKAMARVIACAALLGVSGTSIANASGPNTRTTNAITSATNTITSATTPSASVAVRPGQWEIQTTMTGGPEGVDQPRLRTVCLTQEALTADPLVAFKPEPPAGRQVPTCRTSNVKSNASQISYDTACSFALGTMKTKWQGTVESERYSVTGQARMMGRSINTQVAGTRLGDCVTP
jgi:Protein of unknown function (DUF3617)